MPARFSAVPKTVETFTAAPKLTATAISTTQINLAWAGVTGATGYVVDELVGGVWKPIKTLTGSGTGFSVAGLSALDTYTFRIGAIDAAGTVFSNATSAKTK